MRLAPAHIGLPKRELIAVVGGVLLTLVAFLFAYGLASAAAIPGATYTGPLGATGTITFKTSTDGASVESISFRFDGLPGCVGTLRPNAVSLSPTSPYAITSNAFAGSLSIPDLQDISFSGTFSATGTAQGVVRARFKGTIDCDFGSVNWTATSQTAPPLSTATATGTPSPATATPTTSPAPTSKPSQLWVNYLDYGSAGGGFYWDPSTGQVWTAERGWHSFSPQSATTALPLWVNYLDYGSAGGGFYLDPLTGQVWTSERGWHTFNPTGIVSPPTPTPQPSPTATAVPISLAFTSTRPDGSYTGTPGGVKDYFFLVSGFDLKTAGSGLTVKLSGPRGALGEPGALGGIGGWSWVQAAPQAIAIWLTSDVPGGSYKVTITLKDGRTASASFTHTP